MIDNEYTVIIVLIGFFIIVYIIFSNKNNRKYKVYKTKNYDIKKSIDIKEKKISNPQKNNIDISIINTVKKNNLKEEVLFAEKKQKQMTLSLGFEKESQYIIVNSIAKKFYTIRDIYNFMDDKNIFLNENGFFNKYHIYKHNRCIKYSITNVSNPGYLDKDKIGNLKIKGLSFIMQLPINIDPMIAFNEMMSDAKIFIKKYGGELYDSERKPLSKKTLKNLKKTLEIYKNEY